MYFFFFQNIKVISAPMCSIMLQNTDVFLKFNPVVYKNINIYKELVAFANPEVLSNKPSTSKYFRMMMVDLVNDSQDRCNDVTRITFLPTCTKIGPDSTHSSEESSEIAGSVVIRRRQTRNAKSVPSGTDKDTMLSDQPRSKPVVEETLTKKSASKDEFALSDLFNEGNLNKVKEFGSKVDPNFNSKFGSIFGNGGGSQQPSSGNMGGLGGLGSFGGFGGGSNSGMSNLGSLASILGGGGSGNGGLNVNQFLGTNGFSNFFKKSDTKTPSTLPMGPNHNPYPNYPSAPTNPPPFNPNYPPPPNSGSLYPTLPMDPQRAVPLSPSTINNINNKGSVSLSDIFGGIGGIGGAGTRGTDKAQPNTGPGYDISFGEIFGFGGSKKKEQNPNYPENNHKPSTGGVSLKDILGFGNNKDESKNSYVPSYGTVGGGLEPSKTRPKSSFDEISEGLGLSIDADPITRKDKPVVVLSQPNQSSKSSLTESAYKPRESTMLASQRTHSNTFSSRKPASETSYSSDRLKAVEEEIIQPSKVKRTRRGVNTRGSAKYQQHDGDEILSFNLQNRREKVGVKHNSMVGVKSMHFPDISRGREASSFINNNDDPLTLGLFGKETYGYDIIGGKIIPTHSQIDKYEMTDREYFGTVDKNNNNIVWNPLNVEEVERNNSKLERYKRSTRKEKNMTYKSNFDKKEELLKSKIKVSQENKINVTAEREESRPSSKTTNRKREATYHNEESGANDDSKGSKVRNSETNVVSLNDNLNSGDESQDIVIAEPDSSLVRLRIVRFIKMFSNFFTYALVPVTTGLFNIMKTLVSNYRILQSKNSAEGENGFNFFGSGGNTVTEPTSSFNGFDFSKDLESINDEAESQQDEITTKKTTKVTTSSSSKSTEVKQNKTSEAKEKGKTVTAKPNSKSSKTKPNKKDESKQISFESSSRIKHDDFDFDENLIPRFRRQNKNKNVTETQNSENDED